MFLLQTFDVSITFRKVINVLYERLEKLKQVSQSFHHSTIKLLSTVPQTAEYFPTVQLRSS